MEVAYASAGNTRDDYRDVRVAFVEPDAPEFVLGLKAQIRERLSVLPGELLLNVSRSTPSHEGLEVYNYDDADWPGVVASPSDTWLHADIVPVPPPAGKQGPSTPRQVWRISVWVDAAALKPGNHSGALMVQPEGSLGMSKTVSVEARVRAPVVAIPGQFFFPGVLHGQPVEKEIMVRFQEDSLPSDPSGVVLDHDVGEQLDLRWVVTQGTVWRLKATLTTRGQAASVRGTVRLGFTTHGISELRIPVQALVAREGNGG